MKGERKTIEMAQQNGPSKIPCDGDNGDDPSYLTNLIVNYLPQTMSQDDIRSLFGSIGDIDSCKLIRDKATGQSLGYGFVNYKDPSVAKKAIEALNGLRLQNKTIKVSLARPSCELIKGANLYVSGLSKSMTQRELEALFAPYGHIITSRILCDSQTGLSKGVGFVRFDLRTEAELAIKKLNGTSPPGSNELMTVKFANHPSANGSPMPNVHGSLVPFQPGAIPPFLSPATRQLIHHATAGRIRLDSSPSILTSGLMPTSRDISPWTLFVYNLAPDTDDKVLWQLFGPFGAVQSVKIVRDFSTQKCRGYGFVTMTNYEEAMTAISCLNGFQLSNRVLQVSFKKAKGSGSSSGLGPLM